ncbi:hypothetical protein A0256_21240 [Mucilaginibacter sp. PAMC 26640]|nr:hypothetical protein A0256_21240 [Mucilaginibacter sp. PAMC 26640]
MRFLCLIYFVFALSFTANCQDTAIIKRQANLMAQATFKGDYKTTIAFTYPALITLSGGKEQLQRLITDRMAKLKYQGITGFSGGIASPGKFYTAGNEIHCLVPEDIYIRTAAGRYKSRSYLLGISADNGQNWTFIDVGNMPPEVLHRLLPNFNKDLIIPPSAKPEFLAN